MGVPGWSARPQGGDMGEGPSRGWISRAKALGRREQTEASKGEEVQSCEGRQGRPAKTGLHWILGPQQETGMWLGAWGTGTGRGWGQGGPGVALPWFSASRPPSQA